MYLLQTIALYTFVMFGLGQTDNRITFTPEPESHVWIEGSSNVSEFQCDANEFEGVGLMQQNGRHERQIDSSNLSIQSKIPIDGFDCGKRRMNRDLYNALKGNDHPYITFEFIEAAVRDITSGSSFEVTGKLTAAGVTRVITFNVKGYYLENRQFNIIGQTNISMKDFDIEPPSPLLGLVKVHDRLSVNFDLYIDMHDDALKTDNHE